jgi:hypothetical protein
LFLGEIGFGPDFFDDVGFCECHYGLLLW